MDPTPPAEQSEALSGSDPSPKLGRRRLFTVAGLAAAGVATGGLSYGWIRQAAASQTQPAVVPVAAMNVVTQSNQAFDAEIFYTDMGAAAAIAIADRHGTLSWTNTQGVTCTDFRRQQYRGEPVYTWWESNRSGMAAYTNGQIIIADRDHTELTRFATADGQSPDEHEFLVVGDQAYITSYVKTNVDLRTVGGPRNGLVMDAQWCQVDLPSKKIVRRWSPLEHIDLTESYAGIPDDATTEPWDFFHINSIEPLPDGNILISARHTWGLYKIDPTGRISWRLGGKASDFEVPKNARFAWQHDARWEGDGIIRLFDNATDGTVPIHDQSSILWLEVDEDAMTVKRHKIFTHPDKLVAEAMGNAQLLENGNVLVGWGTAKRITEFSAHGEVLFDATLPAPTYRAYKFAVP